MHGRRWHARDDPPQAFWMLEWTGLDRELVSGMLTPSLSFGAAQPPTLTISARMRPAAFVSEPHTPWNLANKKIVYGAVPSRHADGTICLKRNAKVMMAPSIFQKALGPGGPKGLGRMNCHVINNQSDNGVHGP